MPIPVISNDNNNHARAFVYANPAVCLTLKTKAVDKENSRISKIVIAVAKLKKNEDTAESAAGWGIKDPKQARIARVGKTIRKDVSLLFTLRSIVNCLMPRKINKAAIARIASLPPYITQGMLHKS